MRKLLNCLFFTLTCLLTGCTSESDATNALQSLGFSNVQMTGYHWFACSQDDWFHTGFTAQNIYGKYVSGTVCSGLLFKNATVRFD